jgi:hypothetical protein
MNELTDTLAALKARKTQLASQTAIGAAVRQLLGRGEPLSAEAVDRDIAEIEQRIRDEQARPAEQRRLAARQAELVEIARADLVELRALEQQIVAVLDRTEKTARAIEETSANVHATNGGNFIGLAGPFRGKGPLLGALRAAKLRDASHVWRTLLKETSL